VRVDRKGRYCGDSPCAVITAVTTWIALVDDTSKPIGAGIMAGKGIAINISDAHVSRTRSSLRSGQLTGKSAVAASPGRTLAEVADARWWKGT
jgi:hypothetical protein